MNWKAKLKEYLGLGYISVDTLRKHGAEVGDDVYICTRRVDLAHGFLLKIGSHVTLSDCRILTHDGSTKRALGYSRVGRVEIGNNVFIGAEAIVLPNVKIGNNCIIGAGAVVTRDIPDNSVAVGNPARVICAYDEFVRRNEEALNHTSCRYEAYHTEKSPEEIKKMQRDLMSGGIGYDI